MKRATVHGTIAEKADNNSRFLLQLRAQTSSGGERNGRANNSVGAHESVFRRVHVHASAAPAGASCAFAPEFGENNTSRYSFSQRMTMAAVRAEDQVRRFQMGAHPDRDRLFSHIQMNKSGKPAVAVEFLHFELEKPELEHLLIIGEEQLLRDFLRQNFFRHVKASEIIATTVTSVAHVRAANGIRQ